MMSSQSTLQTVHTDREFKLGYHRIKKTGLESRPFLCIFVTEIFIHHMERLLFTFILTICSVLTLHAQSPEFNGDQVTFRIEGEYATEVKLDGSWLPVPQMMQKNNGLWEIICDGIPADFHTYCFIVDGVRIPDPSNPLLIKDGLDQCSGLYVEGPLSRSYSECRHRGNIDYVWYDSRILGGNRRMSVYTPYGYDKNKTARYPVLYLLHGEGGDEESWLSAGRVAVILDNLIDAGRAVPMIVVMPNGNIGEQASRSFGLPKIEGSLTKGYGATAFESSLAGEIVPFIESHYRAVPKKAYRAVGGLSYGGRQAFNAAYMYADKFDYVCPMSMNLDDTTNLRADLLRMKQHGVKLFWMGCGSADEGALASSQLVHDTMNDIHLFHTFYKNSGGHDWKSWRQYLNAFLPMIFKYYTD